MRAVRYSLGSALLQLCSVRVECCSFLCQRLVCSFLPAANDRTWSYLVMNTSAGASSASSCSTRRTPTTSCRSPRAAKRAWTTCSCCTRCATWRRATSWSDGCGHSAGGCGRRVGAPRCCCWTVPAVGQEPTCISCSAVQARLRSRGPARRPARKKERPTPVSRRINEDH
jgi:hypothetical protein